jgi:hypothetical protein
VSVTEEQLESFGDDELALIISWFSQFHNNRLNRRRGGGPRDGCYGCGDPDHLIAHCPKKNKYTSNKHSSDKYDSGKYKDKLEYTSSKHKQKGGFDKEAIKKKFLKKVKAKERAFLASLSDLDNDTDDDQSSFSPLSDDESEKRREDKLTRHCFIAKSIHRGYCTVAMDEGVKPNKDMLPSDDDTTEVKPTIDALIAELDIMIDTLMSQVKLLKRATHERKEFKDKLEVMEKELEEAKKLVIHVSDEVECDECDVHVTNFYELQSKYVVLLNDNDELKARSSLLGAYKSCLGLQSELAEKNAKILALEKASSGSTVVECARCKSLVLEFESCRRDKMRSEKDNTYLRSILNSVSCSKPQLGMMMSQFRRETGTSGVGFALGGKGEYVYGKVGEFSGLSPSEKPSTTSKLIKINPPKPTEPTMKDRVFEEPPKAPPKKQVWISKPNHLRNPLDTLPNISEDTH